MTNWYILDNGKRWVSCEILSNLLGVCTVRLYTGDVVRGHARQGLYGLLVDAAKGK